MTSKSVCRRLGLQIADQFVFYNEKGVAFYTPIESIKLPAYLLREIADTLDHLTALQQAKEETH